MNLDYSAIYFLEALNRFPYLAKLCPVCKLEEMVMLPRRVAVRAEEVSHTKRDAARLPHRKRAVNARTRW